MTFLRTPFSLLTLLALSLMWGCRFAKTPVDLVLHNAHVVCLDGAGTTAQALAIHQGQIVAVGKEHEILNAYRGDEVHDVAGATVYPGLIDAHSHLLKSVHESTVDAPRLSLEKAATRYTNAIRERGLSHLTVDIDIPAVREDLQQLDNEPSCFCHNDLTPTNIGRLAGRYLAIDWEYAALGSRHFDIAVASHHMEEPVRNTFAEKTAGASFDQYQWQVACRVVPLMDHLWTLAALGHTEGVHSKKSLEKRWGIE